VIKNHIKARLYFLSLIPSLRILGRGAKVFKKKREGNKGGVKKEP
jgi:hypothetical protein